MRSVFLTIVIGLLTAGALSAQDARIIPPQEIPNQNLLKYNRYFMNPTFSRVGVKNSYLSLYSRKQWVQFDDAPSIYMINYTMRVDNNTGVGLGVQQQSNGIINYFGVNANYSYGVQLSEKSWLSAGANVTYFNSGLKGNAATTVDDPLVGNFENTTSLTFKPGMNLTINRFDIGFYAENLLNYDLRNDDSPDAPNIFSGHVMYTQPLGNTGQNMLRGMMRLRRNELENTVLSGNLLLDVTSLGWIQTGYDDFYGGSLGLGFNLSPNISLGYVIEKGFDDNTSNLGVTHEFTLVYQFRDLTGYVAAAYENSELPNIAEDTMQDELVTTELTTRSDTDRKRVYAAKLEEDLSVTRELLTELRGEAELARNKMQPTLEDQYKLQIALARLSEYQNSNPEGASTPLYVNSNDRPSTESFLDYAVNDSSNLQIPNTYPLPNNLDKDFADTTNNLARVKAVEQEISDSDEEIIALMDEIEIVKKNPVQDTEQQKQKMDAIALLETYMATNAQQVATALNNAPNTVNKLNAPLPTGTRFGNAVVPQSVTDLQKAESSNAALTSSSTGTALLNEHTTTVRTPSSSEVSIKERANLNTARSNPNSVAASPENSNSKVYERKRGYYIVANAFKVPENATRFLDKVEKLGFNNSGILQAPNNNMEYVVLHLYSNRAEALAAVNSKMDGKYRGNLWIHPVEEAVAVHNNKIVNATETAVTKNRMIDKEEEQKRGDNAFAKADTTKNGTSLQTLQHDTSSAPPLSETQIVVHTTELQFEEAETIINSSLAPGTKKGYYLVANVFAKNYYHNRFVSKMHVEKRDPNTFKNTANNWNYVYLAYDTGYKSVQALKESKLNGTYNSSLWILKID